MIDSQVVSVASQSPGCCRNCQGVNRNWFLDAGYIEEFWGRVYWCDVCFDQIARICRYEPVDFNSLESARTLNVFLTEKLDRYELLFHRLCDAGINLYDLLAYLEFFKGKQESKGIPTGMASGTETTSQPDSQQRSNDVSDTPSFFKFGLD